MLEGRVAIITGGDRGIGREHALLFASLGAKVVVNGLGGSNSGEGSDMSAAQGVVDEIVATGGKAIASTHSVTSFDDAKALVGLAVEAFGDLHVVVNNAGIPRDRMLASMVDNEFEAVDAVHMKGTFNVNHHAARYWRERTKEGDAVNRAIINTSSRAGLHENVDQTNNAATKARIAAMTLVAGMEGKGYGVRANCIVPISRSQLTLQTPGRGKATESSVFDPENISALVAVLASAGCDFNGHVFSVYGGSVSIYAGWSIAEEVTSEDRWTVEGLAEAMHSLPYKMKVNSQMATLADAVPG
jgi:NAD(P)-dependent dehydrogenase (short-subunit alcohol dehydrogenase family)